MLYDRKRTAKFETIPKPLFPNQVNSGLLPLIEFLGVAHLLCFFVARAQEMCDFYWSFEILDIGSAMFKHEAIDFDASFDVSNPGKAQDNTREYRKTVSFQAL
jgi:hypothetical protein